MKAIVFLNGEPLNGINVSGYDLIVSADGALDYCEKNSIKPDVVLGDFDSLGRVPENAIVYPCDKDLTDGEIALNCAIEKGAKEIVFACSGGLREDHFFGNVSLIEIASKRGVRASLLTNYSRIFFVTGEFSETVEIGSFVSLYALSDSDVECSDGLKYVYNNTKLLRATTLGISNVATKTNVSLKVKSGAVLVFLNHSNVN